MARSTRWKTGPRTACSRRWAWRGFAGRAHRELRATGEIARLARDGLSNPEIGARLFLAPRTVQYHLGNVFAKLGITSCGQLRRVPARHPDTDTLR